MGSLIVIPHALASSTSSPYAKETRQRPARDLSLPTHFHRRTYRARPRMKALFGHRFSRHPALRVGLKSGPTLAHARLCGLPPLVLSCDPSLRVAVVPRSDAKPMSIGGPSLSTGRLAILLCRAAGVPKAKSLFSAGLCRRFARPWLSFFLIARERGPVLLLPVQYSTTRVASSALSKTRSKRP